MKLYLICFSFLLVSLASAQPSPQPVSKVLYSKGHIIAQGFDLRYLNYEVFREETENFPSFSIVSSWMILYENATDILEDGVAMEVFPSKANPDDHYCRQSSRKKLQHLIKSCYANIALRELTQAEKEQLEKFKDEKNGTRSYQLVYDQKMVTAQFSGIDYFQLRDNQDINGMSDFGVIVNRWTENKSEMRLGGMLAEKSFVVEKQPAGSERNCKETDLGWKPSSCSGDIQIRKLTNDH